MNQLRECPQPIAAAADFDALKIQEHSDTSNWLLQPIACTIFPTVSADRKRAGPATWGQLVALLQSPPNHSTKEQCELMVGAEFGTTRTRENSLRSAANMGRVSFIEGDYDDERISPLEAAERLRSAGVESVIYTTARHTEERPRWRVFALLSASCDPTQRKLHVAELNGAARVKLPVASIMQPLAEYVRGAKRLRRPSRVPG